MQDERANETIETIDYTEETIDYNQMDYNLRLQHKLRKLALNATPLMISTVGTWMSEVQHLKRSPLDALCSFYMCRRTR